MANAYVMRTNMSVAIVAMVNHTFVEAGNEEAVDDECPEYENITSSVSYLTAYHYWFQIPKLSCWTISYATKCKLCMETECIRGVGTSKYEYNVSKIDRHKYVLWLHFDMTLFKVNK